MRFPEFSGEWTKIKIKNIFENVTRGYVLSKKDISTIKTNIFKYPVYSSQTLNNGLLGYYLNYLYENAITWTTDGANAGEVNFRRDKFYCTNVCGVLLSNNGYCNDCMAAIINKITKKFVSFVGNPKLMNNVMENIEIIFPSNIKEQLKVASFLSLIDKRIELQNKIIKDYELLKKLLMNKFLSNFNLREISIYSLVKSQLIRIIKASELKKFNGTKSYLSTSSIDENGSISPEKEISFFDRPSRASMIPYRNSVWFARMKDTNKVYISKNNDEEKYILSTGFYGILPIENDIDPIWLFEIFKSKYFIVQKDKLSEGGTMSGIKDSQLNELNIKIWLDKEMQNFACKLLKSFTKIIEIELGKENSLIKLKSYLLKTLFI